MSSVIVQILSPEGVTIAFDASSLEGAQVMIKSLIRQGFKPVASAAPEGAPRAADLRPLTQQLAALVALVEGLHASAPVASAALPSATLEPLVAGMSQLTDRVQHALAQLASVVQRLEALAGQLTPRAEVLPEAVAASNGTRRARPAASRPRHGEVPAAWLPLLAYLTEHGPTRPYALDRALGLAKSRDVLRRLAAAGQVRRQPDGCYAVAADGC